MLRSLYNRAVVVLDQLRCGGLTHSGRACEPAKDPVGLRRPQHDCIDVARVGAESATDTLSVAWLRGGFGRGAGASPAGFLYHMDWLEDVYSKVGPSGVSPPVHERSHGNSSLAPVGHCLSG